MSDSTTCPTRGEGVIKCVVAVVDIEVHDHPTCAQSGVRVDATAQAPRQQSDIDD